MKYIITDGKRKVYKHKKYDRYYVQRFDDECADLFVTDDYQEACEVRDSTRANWSPGFKIVEIDK